MEDIKKYIKEVIPYATEIEVAEGMVKNNFAVKWRAYTFTSSDINSIDKTYKVNNFFITSPDITEDSKMLKVVISIDIV